MNKKISLIALPFMVLPLVGCGNLPKYISQDDWDKNRQYIQLSTGMKMCYVEMGDPNGKPIILQHGMTDNTRSWSLAAPYFAEAGYHVYLTDLRGQGKSQEMDGHYTTYTYATDLNAFFDAKKIDKAIVVGHSLGSFTMQTFWLMYPQRVEKTVLVSSIPMLGYQATGLQYIYDHYVKDLKEGETLPDSFMDDWYATKESEVEEDIRDVYFNKFIKNMKAEAKGLSKKAWTNIIFGMLESNLCGSDKDKNMYKYFDKSKDCLILHGAEDTFTKGIYQDELISLLSNEAKTNVTYRDYENIGHNIQFVAPRRCTTDILGWLKDGKLPEIK